jgi:hypothetical protein
MGYTHYWTSEPNKIEDTEVLRKEVEQRAEEKMLKTGKLEGSHYAAMKQIAEE